MKKACVLFDSKLAVPLAFLFLVALLVLIQYQTDITGPHPACVPDPDDPRMVQKCADNLSPEDVYLPVVGAGLLDFGPWHPDKPIVNHGHGWFYFPYQTDEELIRALIWFHDRRPDIESHGGLDRVAESGGAAALPSTVSLEAEQLYGGKFMFFQPCETVGL